MCSQKYNFNKFNCQNNKLYKTLPTPPTKCKFQATSLGKKKLWKKYSGVIFSSFFYLKSQTNVYFKQKLYYSIIFTHQEIQCLLYVGFVWGVIDFKNLKKLISPMIFPEWFGHKTTEPHGFCKDLLNNQLKLFLFKKIRHTKDSISISVYG